MTLSLASDPVPKRPSARSTSLLRATDGLGIPDLILAKITAGEERAAELTARLATESGYSLTELYECLRKGIYLTFPEGSDVETLKIAELDQRLVGLSARLAEAPPRRREPEAIVLSTLRHGIPAALCHIFRQTDIPALTLDFSNFAKHRRGGAGIPGQFPAVRYVIVDAGVSGAQELSRLYMGLQQLRLIGSEFNVILLADDKMAADASKIHNSPNFTMTRSLPGVMLAAGLASENPLTAREQDVLSYIADGATNQQAARALGISIATVKTYLERAQSKLQSADRASAVAVALRRGWM